MTYTDPRFGPGFAPRPMTGPTYWAQDQNPLGTPHGGPPGPPSRGPRTNHTLRSKIVAGVLAASVVLGGGAWFAATSGTASADVQTVSFAGDAPFTAPVGTDQPDVAGSDATGAQSGTAPGTFAATTPPACDGAALVAQLQADPAKAQAWAQVEGIAPAEIPSYVKSLSPAVLRADTAVTDHGFRDGHFTEAPAVLAQGTAVMVSSYGQPTVKCFNGNPLTPPSAPVSDAVTITPSAAAVGALVFSSADGGGQITTPAPKPVGPTPAQIAAAQKAREDANAAARGAVKAQTKANETAAASRTADAKATADALELSKANSALTQAQQKLGQVQGQINSIQASLAQPLPASIRKALLTKLNQLTTQDLPAAVTDVADKTGKRNTAQTDANASKADAATKKQAAADAKAEAEKAQKDAEAKEKAAQEKEKDAGLPSPKDSRKVNALKDQADLAKVSDQANKLTKDVEDPTTVAEDRTAPDGTKIADDPTTIGTGVDPAKVPATVTDGTTPGGSGKGTTSAPSGTSTDGTSTSGTSSSAGSSSAGSSSTGTSSSSQGSSTSSSGS